MAAMTKEKTKKQRKLRPKLQPISPDNLVSQSFDDEGFGFGEILTGAAAAASVKDNDDAMTTTTTEKELSQSSMMVSTTFSSSEDGGETQSQYYTEREKKEEDGSDNVAEHATDSGGSGSSSANHHPMAQYSSITSPSASAIKLETLCLDEDISKLEPEEDEATAVKKCGMANESMLEVEGNVISPIKLSSVSKNEDGETMGNESNVCIKGRDNSDDSDQSSDAPVGDDTNELQANQIPINDGDISESDDNNSGCSKDTNRKGVDPPSNEEEDDCSSSSSSESSSSSSSDNSESEFSDIQIMDNDQNNMTQLQQLQNEIRSRQKQMAKLLRDKEGSAYARMIQSQEDAVNSQLLASVQQREPEVPLSETTNKALLDTIRNKSTESKAGPSSKASNTLHTKPVDPFRTIQLMLLDEYFHTLPGAISLILHCILYITIYAIISKSTNWLSDAIVGYFTDWAWEEDDDFDYSFHENVFNVIVLLLALFAARITGVLYDWNENKAYQKRVDFYFRNKWFLAAWDVRVMNFFLGEELREEYEKEISPSGSKRGETMNSKAKRWGPRLKLIFDIFSFFICYKCVDSLVYFNLILPMTDITDAVLAGLPSAQLKDHHLDRHLVDNGHSYACSSVMDAFENPYASDMLNFIANMEDKSEEARNWIVNAEKCGWSGPPKEDGGTEEKNDDDDGSKDESSHPSFLKQKLIMSVHDDKYIQETISSEAYYALVGNPSPRFFDPVRETLFMLISTAICCMLLRILGIPFLLI